MSDNPLIEGFLKIHEAGGIGGGISGTKFSNAASYAPVVRAGVLGAVDNITMGAVTNPEAREKYPVAYKTGDAAATVAQVATGVGAAKALAGVAIRKAAKSAVDNAATKTTRQFAAKDFELGAQNTLGLTPQMRVPRPTLKLTKQMRTEEENESSKGNTEMSTNPFIESFLKLQEKVGPRPGAFVKPVPATPDSSTSTMSSSPRPQPNPRNQDSSTSTMSSSPRPQTGQTAPTFTLGRFANQADAVRREAEAAPQKTTETNPPPATQETNPPPDSNKTVVKGDNLWNMVKKPGMSNADIANEVDRVAKLNKLADPNKIQIGQKLNFGEENTEMSINPFIKGFFDIEEARAKNTNIFDESKKLTAAQKKHLDKNDNDKIDAEDFEMLRKKSYNEQATPRMTADQVKAASKGGSPNPTAQKEFDDTVAGAEQKVDASKFLIKQGLKYAGKSVGGPIGGLIGSALGSIANKKMYNEEEAIEEAKKNNAMVMAGNISKVLKAAKPDFLDIDKDGDKEEPMKKAAADMKKEEVEFSEEEIDFINSVMEAMPVAPTSEGDSPNPTPKKKAEGSRAKGSMAD